MCRCCSGTAARTSSAGRARRRAAATIDGVPRAGMDLVPGTGPARGVRARARSTPGCCCCATSGRGSSPTSLPTRSATRATASRCLPGIARAISTSVRRGESAALWLAVGRAAAQPGARRHLRAARRGRRARRARRRSTRRATRGTAAGSPRRCRPRAPHGRRPRRLLGDGRGAGLVRLPRLDGVQDRAVGPGAGVPAAARAARRLRAGRVPRRRARPHGDRVREARVRRPRGVLRRLGAGAARAAALARVRGGAAGAGRRRGLGRAAARAGRIRGCRRSRPGAADRRRSASRRSATRAISTSPTGTATSCRRRRAAAGCRARRRSRAWASASARARRCSGSRRGCRLARAGGVRPRTTLSPSLAVHEDGTVLAFGTPGGDQQDQWSLELFLAHAVFGRDLQAAIDAPMFHTTHFPSSFFPREADAAAGGDRGARAGGDGRGAARARARRRGHRRLVARPASAVSRAPDGVLRAAANPRGMQGYAVGLAPTRQSASGQPRGGCRGLPSDTPTPLKGPACSARS